MVQIPIGWGSQLECPKADVIECLIVNTECLISIFNQLVDRKGGIVGLDNSVRNLKARNDGSMAPES
jgi:hypothetical protein